MADRHISWQNFQRHFLDSSVGGIHPVLGRPEAKVFVEPGSGRIGARIAALPVSTRVADWLPQEIELLEYLERGETFVEISCSRVDLFEAFYAVMTRFCDLVQVNQVEPYEAARQACEEFSSLVRRRRGLTEDEEAGLWGELWVLDRLISLRGVSVLNCWTGWASQAHDFRIASSEVEVKTTRGARRRHMISGLGQLQPSPLCNLWIVSIQLALAGTHDAGKKLSDLIQDIRGRLSADASSLAEFERRLDRIGAGPAVVGRLGNIYRMRTDPVRIEVTDSNGMCFPRIVGTKLEAAIGSDASARIDDVHYRVDLEGLGTKVTDGWIASVGSHVT